MNKIVVGDARFDEAPFPITDEPSIYEKRRKLNGISRDSIRITMRATYSEIAECFVNGISWGIEETSVYGGALKKRIYDKSEYSVAGDIIDHRNGTITVYMSKPTETESMRPVYELGALAIECGISLESKPNIQAKKGCEWKPVLKGSVISWEETSVNSDE